MTDYCENPECQNPVFHMGLCPPCEKKLDLQKFRHSLVPMMGIKKVILESPYKGKNKDELVRNIRYARACLRDSLLRGEAPIASHLLYTQEGVLDDNNFDERAKGINAGLAWGIVADMTVVYQNFGITEGMKQGIERAQEEKRITEFRWLKDKKLEELSLI